MSKTTLAVLCAARCPKMHEIFLRMNAVVAMPSNTSVRAKTVFFRQLLGKALVK